MQELHKQFLTARLLPMTFKVQIKQRLPRSIAPRTRFQLGQIQIAFCEFAQAMIKRRRTMARGEDEEVLL